MGRSDAVRHEASSTARRVLEACLLAAVVVIPILFHIRTSAVFEPVRAAVLRSLFVTIAVFGALQWLGGARSFREGARSFREGILILWRNPLGAAFCLTAGSYVVSGLLSIDPHLSRWGPYVRGQGVFTYAAYLVAFLAVLCTLRSEHKVRRALQAMVFASVPVAVYGLFQAVGADPLRWVGSQAGRISAQAGNPIFLGAYLIMVIPVSIALGVEALRVEALGRPRDRSWRISGLALAYGAAALLQTTVVLMTRSRGPVLGLLAGAIFMGLMALRSASRRVARFAVGTAASTLVVLVVLVLPSGPLQQIRDSPALEWTGIQRYSGLFELTEGTVASRLLLWEVMLDVARDDPVRLFVGYGPETQVLAHTSHYRPRLAGMEQNFTVDRAHNRTYDLVVTRGLPALFIDFLLVGGLLWLALAGTGALSSRGRKRWLATSCLVGLALGGIVPLALGAPALAGPLVALGALAGVLAFLCGDLVWRRESGDGKGAREGAETKMAHRLGLRSLLLIAAGAAAVAHYVESQVGIETVTTRLYLWMFAGLVAAAGIGWSERDASTLEPDTRSSGEWGLIVGLGLATVTFGFVTATSPLASRMPVVITAVVVAWVAGGLVVMGRDGRPLAAYAVRSLSVLAVLAPLQILWVRWVGISELTTAGTLSELADQVSRLSWTLPLFVASMLAVILVFAAPAKADRRSLLIGVAALGVILPAAWMLSITPARAGAFVHMGERYEARGGAVPAARLYAEAARLRPGEPTFLAHAARSSMLVAGQQPTGSEGQRVAVQTALAWSVRARDLRPLDPRFHTALGELETEAGLGAADEQVRGDHYRRADEAFSAAVAAGPRIPGTWTSWGQWVLRRGDAERAVTHLERARSLDAEYRAIYGPLGAALLQLELLPAARDAFRKAVDLRPRDGLSWQGLGAALLRMRDHEASVEAFLRAVELGAEDMLTYRDLALALGELGRVQLATSYAEKALEVAPVEAQGGVRRLLDPLRAMSDGAGADSVGVEGSR